LVLWILETYAMYNIMAIMGTEGRYEYNFYARPIGYVRQTLQAIADDEELQTLIGMYNTQTIEDELCYTVAQCQEVADFELMVVKDQRKRVKISKIAHLQDEEGDMIQINHPQSNLPMKIFITDLTRVMKLPDPENLASEEAGFVDEIEGWNVS